MKTDTLSSSITYSIKLSFQNFTSSLICIFSESLNLQYPSMTIIIYSTGPMEGLSIDNVARDKHSQTPNRDSTGFILVNNTNPGIPSIPSASDKGRPAKSGIMYGFFSQNHAPGSSAFTTALVCHPKCPTTWIPTSYSGWQLSRTLKMGEVHMRLTRRDMTQGVELAELKKLCA